MTDDADPMILYVLMRTDVPDYMSGKHMAQANHAGTHLMAEAREWTVGTHRADLEEWLAQAGGFGTCVTKAVTYKQLRDAIEAGNCYGVPLGIIRDPSYPITDGDRTVSASVETCGYLFGRYSVVEPLVRELPRFSEPR